jgi:hypothetical protein
MYVHYVPFVFRKLTLLIILVWTGEELKVLIDDDHFI